MTYMDLSYNQLYGPLPAAWNTNALAGYLETLNVAFNQITSAIPAGT